MVRVTTRIPTMTVTVWPTVLMPSHSMRPRRRYGQDGTGNNADTDDDGDGVADSADAFPLDATETLE